ncbi:MAG: ATP-dependent zinc protease [Methylococcales bacterium]|nr:ATP-dependent zinc protease [Methylococcales bacterium]
MTGPETYPLLGWREWLALPDLDINPIKAKIDSGARSSALHAFKIRAYRKGGQRWVAFSIHPYQDDDNTVVECHAPVKDRRRVTDSGGHSTMRYVIETRIVIGDHDFTGEMTLTNRDTMKFRMLLGRTAMQHRFCIDPAASYLQGQPKP